MNSMQDIVIVGAGGFGREVKMLIDQINEKKTHTTFWDFMMIILNYPI